VVGRHRPRLADTSGAYGSHDWRRGAATIGGHGGHDWRGGAATIGGQGRPRLANTAATIGEHGGHDWRIGAATIGGQGRPRLAERGGHDWRIRPPRLADTAATIGGYGGHDWRTRRPRLAERGGHDWRGGAATIGGEGRPRLAGRGRERPKIDEDHPPDREDRRRPGGLFRRGVKSDDQAEFTATPSWRALRRLGCPCGARWIGQPKPSRL
jgi:hypothetical protein